MSVEQFKADLNFAASQGSNVAVMTTQEACRAVLAEAEAVYVVSDFCTVTGQRAAELYDDELLRNKKLAEENAGLRDALRQVAVEADDNLAVLRIVEAALLFK